jgi:hypothetical protein
MTKLAAVAVQDQNPEKLDGTIQNQNFHDLGGNKPTYLIK